MGAAWEFGGAFRRQVYYSLRFLRNMCSVVASSIYLTCVSQVPVFMRAIADIG